MDGQNPENFSDGDWDEKGELAWNEHDWQQYLNRNEKEMYRFISFYKKLEDRVNRLDEIAILMGWDRDEWTVTLDMPTEPVEEGAWSKEEAFAEEDDPEMENIDPYTVHRHPVYVITRGLYRYALEEWEKLCVGDSVAIDASLAFKFPQSLRDGEYHAIMGIYAVDIGDYNLCVCHLKNALACVNKSLALMNDLPMEKESASERYHALSHILLFDLRELWLRVMNECREEFRRGFRG